MQPKRLTRRMTEDERTARPNMIGPGPWRAAWEVVPERGDIPVACSAQEWSQASDPVLIMGIARSHQEALAEAYRRHAGMALALAQRLLSHQALAEDVTREVFLHLWHHPEDFDPDRGTLRAAVLTATHRRAIDVIRSQTPRRPGADPGEVTAIDSASDAEIDLDMLMAEHVRDALLGAAIKPVFDVELGVEDVITAEHVRDALDMLGGEQRQAIELAYFGGQSAGDVAATLGQPKERILIQLRVGLRRLHQHLQAVGLMYP